MGYCRWSAELNLSAQSKMSINKKRTRVGSEVQYGPRTVGEILHDYLENSNEPLAVAYREHKNEAEAEVKTDRLFVDLFPDTFLDVDLKLLTRQPGRMPVGEYLPGVLVRIDEGRFSFIQDALERNVAVRRNPHVYKGVCINVNQKADGTPYPTFNRPPFTKGFTFGDFCRAAAEELLMVAGLIERKTKRE